MACIQAGKHVVMEKPMTATAEEGETLKRAADEKGVLLSVYHNRRWDNDFLTIKKLISEGSLEDINTYQVSYNATDLKFKRGGGKRRHCHWYAV